MTKEVVTHIRRRRPADDLARAGWHISTLTAIQPAAAMTRDENTILLRFQTQDGSASQIYSLDSFQLTEFLDVVGIEADEGDEVNLNEALGRKALILWGFTRKFGRLYPKPFQTKPATAKTPEYKPLTAVEWANFGCDKDGVKNAVATTSPKQPAARPVHATEAAADAVMSDNIPF